MAIYSHSKLTTFENCPLQYKLKYINEIKRPDQTIEAFLGKCFHAAMEWLYKEIQFKIPQLNEVFEFFDKEWEREWDDSVLIKEQNLTPKDYINLGHRCIENYYKRNYPFEQSRILGLERRIEIDLDEIGKYKIIGYIDRLSQTFDGTYQIHDYKTSTGEMPPQSYFDNDRQLGLYQIWVENQWNDARKVELIWHYVALDKEMKSTRTKQQLSELKAQTLQLIMEIESAIDFPPKEGPLCQWCVYWDLCPRRKHFFMIESLSKEELKDEDSLTLVDQYATLNEKKKSLEREIEKLKERLITFSEAEGLEVIRGSNHKVTITSKETIRFPKKNTIQRAELINTIKSLGIWDDVSDLDTTLLKNFIKSMGDKGFKEKIEKYLTYDLRKEVRLSKLRE